MPTNSMISCSSSSEQNTASTRTSLSSLSEASSSWKRPTPSALQHALSKTRPQVNAFNRGRERVLEIIDRSVSEMEGVRNDVAIAHPTPRGAGIIRAAFSPGMVMKQIAPSLSSNSRLTETPLRRWDLPYRKYIALRTTEELQRSSNMHRAAPTLTPEQPRSTGRDSQNLTDSMDTEPSLGNLLENDSQEPPFQPDLPLSTMDDDRLTPDGGSDRSSQHAAPSRKRKSLSATARRHQSRKRKRTIRQNEINRGCWSDLEKIALPDEGVDVRSMSLEQLRASVTTLAEISGIVRRRHMIMEEEDLIDPSCPEDGSGSDVL